MIETYSVAPVARDLFRGLLTVVFLGVCFLSILTILFLILANNSDEAREKAQWCVDHMPEATDSECAVEAGW